MFAEGASELETVDFGRFDCFPNVHVEFDHAQNEIQPVLGLAVPALRGKGEIS